MALTQDGPFNHYAALERIRKIMHLAAFDPRTNEDFSRRIDTEFNSGIPMSVPTIEDFSRYIQEGDLFGVVKCVYFNRVDLDSRFDEFRRLPNHRCLQSIEVTMLQAAAFKGNLDMVTLLIAAGADPCREAVYDRGMYTEGTINIAELVLRGGSLATYFSIENEMSREEDIKQTRRYLDCYNLVRSAMVAKRQKPSCTIL